MKTILYIIKDNYSNPSTYGVYNKVKGQLNAFNSLGYKSLIIYINGNNIFLSDYSFNKIKSLGCFKNEIDKYYKFYKIIYYFIKTNSISIVYHRYPFSEFFYLHFLKKIKKKDIKYIIEFPSFPYSKEFKGVFAKFKLLLDNFFRLFLNRYVEYSVNYNGLSRIYKINSISLENGIIAKEKYGVNSFCNKRKEKYLYTKKLHIIGVAKLTEFQGYDRIITGLNNYYLNKNDVEVFFHVIGTGPDIKNLLNLVTDKAKKYVNFYGYKKHNFIDSLYEESNIGAGSLGIHRKNMNYASVLKVREYCINYLPFIKSYIDPDFEDFKYCLDVEPNDKPIDMYKVIEFYESIIDDKKMIENFNDKINNVISWEAKMKKVINYVESN